jgi:hypothetical protein
MDSQIAGWDWNVECGTKTRVGIVGASDIAPANHVLPESCALIIEKSEHLRAIHRPRIHHEPLAFFQDGVDLVSLAGAKARR